MKGALRLLAVLAALAPSLSTSAVPEDVARAALVDDTLYAPNSGVFTEGVPAQFAAPDSVGPIDPQHGDTMAMLFTGDVDEVESGVDTDWGTPGTAGDCARLEFVAAPPLDTASVTLRYRLLTREPSADVGEQDPDVVSGLVFVDGDEHAVVCTSGGGALTTHNAPFMTNPPKRIGSGFEGGRLTPWRFATVPASWGQVTFLFELCDGGDGLDDTALLVDSISFSDMVPPAAPCLPAGDDDDAVDDDDTADDDDTTDDDDAVDDDDAAFVLRIDAVGPTAIPPDRSVRVLITGAGFDDEVSVRLGGQDAFDVRLVDSETLTARFEDGFSPGLLLGLELNAPGRSTASLPASVEVLTYGDEDDQTPGCAHVEGSFGAAWFLVILLVARRRVDVCGSGIEQWGP